MIRQADIGASKAIQVMLVENCQRADLNPVEKAVALGQLRDFGLTTVRIAKAVGISDATVSTYLLLLELDKRTQDRVRRGDLPMMTAVTAVRKTRKLDRARRGKLTAARRCRGRGSRITGRRRIRWPGRPRRCVMRGSTRCGGGMAGLAGSAGSGLSGMTSGSRLRQLPGHDHRHGRFLAGAPGQMPSARR